jgi:hypothetical protein
VPEFWLHYGEVEVGVEVKAENLLGYVEPAWRPLQDAEVEKQLEGADTTRPIVIPEPSSATLALLTYLLRVAQPPTGQVQIFVPEEDLYYAKVAAENYQAEVMPLRGLTEIGVIDGIRIKAPYPLTEKGTIILTSTDFDPLFGFGGGPPAVLRVLDPQVGVAVGELMDERPRPGEVTGASKFAERVAGLLPDHLAYEVIPTEGGLAHLAAGSLVEAHRAASEELGKRGAVRVERAAHGVVVSPGFDPVRDRLDYNLKALMNVAGAVREGGEIILVAECSRGLGNPEFHSLIQRGPAWLKRARSRPKLGLEPLAYLESIKRRHKVTLVSTLPNYYVRGVLGLDTAPRISVAVEALVSRGRAQKLYLAPWAAITRLTR